METSQLPTVIDNSMSPGQQFSADEQCRQLYGSSSFYCAVRITLCCNRTPINRIALQQPNIHAENSVYSLCTWSAV